MRAALNTKPAAPPCWTTAPHVDANQPRLIEARDDEEILHHSSEPPSSCPTALAAAVSGRNNMSRCGTAALRPRFTQSPGLRVWGF